MHAACTQVHENGPSKAGSAWRPRCAGGAYQPSRDSGMTEDRHRCTRPSRQAFSFWSRDFFPGSREKCPPQSQAPFVNHTQKGSKRPFTCGTRVARDKTTLAQAFQKTRRPRKTPAGFLVFWLCWWSNLNGWSLEEGRSCCSAVGQSVFCERVNSGFVKQLPRLLSGEGNVAESHLGDCPGRGRGKAYPTAHRKVPRFLMSETIRYILRQILDAGKHGPSGSETGRR